MQFSTNTLWRPRLLITGNCIAFLLMISWLLEPTRSLWLALDANAFWAMNNSLNWGAGWQRLWAIANNRAFDLAAAVSMLSLFAYRAWIDDRKKLNHYLALGLFLFITLIVSMQLGKALPIERPSATAHFPEALRLTELVPDISTKDYSGDSFPGDHGLVLLICTGFAIAYLPPLYALLAALFCLIFTLPRLMSGAHWLTDEIVGAVAVGSFILSWVFASPLHEKAISKLENWVASMRQRIAGSSSGD